MRKIKFRAIREDTKEMAYGSYVEGTIIDTKNDKAYEVDEKTVEEFTGLQDAEGTEIFEGDIVSIYGNEKNIGLVKFEYGAFKINKELITSYGQRNIKIVGSLSTTPELLDKYIIQINRKGYFTGNFDDTTTLNKAEAKIFNSIDFVNQTMGRLFTIYGYIKQVDLIVVPYTETQN